MKKDPCCSFCYAPSKDCGRLVKGHQAFICHACAEFAVKIHQASAENEEWKALQKQLKAQDQKPDDQSNPSLGYGKADKP